MIQNFAFVALGGALGACARYAVVLVTAALAGTGFPYSTMIVNVVGSFIMGVIVELSLEHVPLSDGLRAMVVVGVLGSFTTFSTFSLDVFTLFERDRMVAAGLYMMASVVLSIGALVAGLMLVRRLAG